MFTGFDIAFIFLMIAFAYFIDHRSRKRVNNALKKILSSIRHNKTFRMIWPNTISQDVKPVDWASIYQEHLDRRNRFIANAKQMKFIDAVFCINYYNRHEKIWGAGPKPPDITPDEVFDSFDKDNYADCLARSNHLMNAANRVAKTHFRPKKIEETHEEAFAKMTHDNPGFSERSYSMAVNAAMVGCR